MTALRSGLERFFFHIGHHPSPDSGIRYSVAAGGTSLQVFFGSDHQLMSLPEIVRLVFRIPAHSARSRNRRASDSVECVVPSPVCGNSISVICSPRPPSQSSRRLLYVLFILDRTSLMTDFLVQAADLRDSCTVAIPMKAEECGVGLRWSNGSDEPAAGFTN